MRAILTFHNTIVRGKVTGQCLLTTTFEEKGQPKRIRTEVPLLYALQLTARPNRFTRTNTACRESLYRHATTGPYLGEPVWPSGKALGW